MARLTVYSNVISAVYLIHSLLVNGVLLNDIERTQHAHKLLKGKNTLYYIYNKNLTLLWFEKIRCYKKKEKLECLYIRFRTACFETAVLIDLRLRNG